MEATFVHGPQTNIDYTPSGADVDAGAVVIASTMAGVALKDIADGELGALAIQGVFDFTKAAGGGTAIALGDAVYWDDTANAVTETSAGNTLLGKCVKAAADADTTCRVFLNP